MRALYSRTFLVLLIYSIYSLRYIYKYIYAIYSAEIEKQTNIYIYIYMLYIHAYIYVASSAKSLVVFTPVARWGLCRVGSGVVPLGGGALAGLLCPGGWNFWRPELN